MIDKPLVTKQVPILLVAGGTPSAVLVLAAQGHGIAAHRACPLLLVVDGRLVDLENPALLE